MLYFVIEYFKDPAAIAEVYKRFAEKGRMLPNGLHYVDSWVEANLRRCFQLMETDDPELFDQWTARWNDLVDFEITPVTKSSTASDLIISNAEE